MKRISKDIPAHLNIGFEWDARDVWKVEAPVILIRISDLMWHMDEPFWDITGTDDFNLSPRELIEKPELNPLHFEMIKNADLSYPLDAVEHNGKFRLLDGVHRLAKAYMEGKESVQVRIIPVEKIPKITRSKTAVVL